MLYPAAYRNTLATPYCGRTVMDDLSTGLQSKKAVRLDPCLLAYHEQLRNIRRSDNDVPLQNSLSKGIAKNISSYATRAVSVTVADHARATQSLLKGRHNGYPTSCSTDCRHALRRTGPPDTLLAC